MAVGLSINTAALQGAVAAMKAADRRLRADINTATRQDLAPAWQRTIRNRTVTRQDEALLRVGTRLAAGNPPTLQAATSRRPMSRRRKGRGTLIPAQDYGIIEFGSTKNKTGRVPPYHPEGRIVYPAARAIAPYAAARWAKAIRDAYIDRANLGTETNG